MISKALLTATAVGAALILSTTAAAQTLPPDAAAFKAHVSFLASDAMRGREAGSAEYDMAAQYVAARFEEYGLKPAGDKGSYLQSVPLLSAQLIDKGSVTLRGSGGDVALTFGDDFLVSPSLITSALKIEAPLVFVGFGVVAPEYKRNDYAGVDVRGKIVVVLGGAPKSISGEERAHYGNGTTKALVAEARGAIGIISVETPTRFKVRPFAESARTWDAKRMVWRQPDGTGFTPGGKARGLASISLKGAEKLFQFVPGGAAAIMAAAETPAAMLKAQPLKLSAIVTANTEIKPAQSSNVAGLFEGSDPALKAEMVVLSGHLDHIGVGAPIDGDSINNGAMDNAVGIAAMIEVAKAMNAAPRPKRSVLFLAVTAEEKGLIGSDYYARHPTLPKENLIANVNLDMPIITYDFTDVIAFGADHSSIGAVVSAAGKPFGIKMSPDPTPDEGIFTRSDHYRFVQQGIPSVFVVPGYSGQGGVATAAFLKSRYHKPSDDMTAPFVWSAGTKFVALNLAIARALADAPERPHWNKGDFFGTLYDGLGAK